MLVQSVIAATVTFLRHSVPVWCCATLLYSSMSFAAADPRAAEQIRDAVAASQFPFMRDVVKPFFEQSTATSALIKLGKARGYGAEWNPGAEEWRQAVVALHAAAPKERIVGWKIPWPDCLEELSAEDLQSFARAVKSPEWQDVLKETDLMTSILGMLSVQDQLLFPERDRIAERAQREGASIKDPASIRLRKTFGAKLQGCFSAALGDIQRRHMPAKPGPVPDAATIAAPFLDRFDARHPALWGEWLLRAINAGDLARVTRLLDLGADVNGLARRPIGSELVPPLYVAASSAGPNQKALLDSLIKRGADVNARTSNGKTPLFGASSLEVVRYLVDYGADVLARTSYGAVAYDLLPGDSPTGVFLREKAEEAVRKKGR